MSSYEVPSLITPLESHYRKAISLVECLGLRAPDTPCLKYSCETKEYIVAFSILTEYCNERGAYGMQFESTKLRAWWRLHECKIRKAAKVQSTVDSLNCLLEEKTEELEELRLYVSDNTK